MNNKNVNKPKQPGNKKPKNSSRQKKTNGQRLSSSRGAAIRAQRRANEDAHRKASQYMTAAANGGNKEQPRPRANFIDDSPRLKFVGFGGMDGGGSKNTLLVEYKNDAIIMDCGSDLGVDLPGINYGIADMSYLDSIKHKLKAYVITHGHLDHIGALPHILPKYPAPVYGSRFTIGRVEEIFENFSLPLPENFELKTVIMNEDNHERLKVGEFFVELVRITHSIPGSNCIVLDTPVGRIINTGDFRLDPNPLDHERTDVERLKQLGKEGVLVLLSESTTSDRLGRTPSESTIEQTFKDIMSQAPGRIFISLFSTNMNRVQMLINAAVHHNKKVAMDGRSMVSTLEMAIRNGFVKVPKGTFVPIASVPNMKDDEVIIVCTGSQGEPNSALQRMSTGDHAHIKLKEQDTVVLSSTPIPYTGNDSTVRNMVNDMFRKNVHIFRHESRDVDSCGPLHVSGHASRDEYGEMIDMVRPKFFIPIYGDYTAKKYHIELAVEHGIPRKNCLNVGNGETVLFTKNTMELGEKIPHGTVLVDQTGAIVSSVVVKDRLMLSNEGLVAIVLTIDKKTGQLMTSPDIISRGFIYMKDEEELMNSFRTELKRAVAQRFKRVDVDRFKLELKEHITHFLYDQTGRSPIVIPVVNIIGLRRAVQQKANGQPAQKKSPQEEAEELQKRYAEMRSRLLNQDARID
ncbi:MAG TPA: ribonuclease J [Candidatus Saccharimonadales bacterium]|nr:ribonuclease J [Candidatus Saccharimonadales bacterium]